MMVGMPGRFSRLLVRLAVAVAAVAVLGAGLLTAAPDPAAAATTTRRTPVMGPDVLSPAQLAAWYQRHKGSNVPRIPVLNDNVAELARIFIAEGRRDGVRGDLAFVQSMLETGWLGFKWSQIPPDAYNYAGIYAFGGRQSLLNCKNGDSAPSRCMGSPAKGVRTQIQLLRSYADPSVKGMTGRLISAPSDRAGMAPYWEYFGGDNCPCGKLIWAAANDYGLYIIRMYSQAVVEAGLARPCDPYTAAPPTNASGTGFWLVTRDSVVHAVGAAKWLGDPRKLALDAPLVGGRVTPSRGGYWLLARDGGIFTYGDAVFRGSTGGMRLDAPVNGMERTSDGRGYWLVADDGGIFTFGAAKFYGSMGAKPISAPILGMERTLSGFGYWLFGRDGRVYPFGDAKSYGSIAGGTLASPVVAMHRTVTGNGYWLLTRAGKVYAFGDAAKYGDLVSCTNLDGATRMLASPTGKGYWIATGSGAVVAFGDAKPLGFPAVVGDVPVALLPLDRPVPLTR